MSFSVIAPMKKGSVGLKACENFPGVGMRSYLIYDGDACRNVSVMSEQTGRQTDRQTGRQADRQANSSL